MSHPRGVTAIIEPAQCTITVTANLYSGVPLLLTTCYQFQITALVSVK